MSEKTQQITIVAGACLFAWLIMIVGCCAMETNRVREEQMTWRAKYQWDAKAKMNPCDGK